MLDKKVNILNKKANNCQMLAFFGRIPMKINDSGLKKCETNYFGVVFEVPGPENPPKIRK